MKVVRLTITAKAAKSTMPVQPGTKIRKVVCNRKIFSVRHTKAYILPFFSEFIF